MKEKKENKVAPINLLQSREESLRMLLEQPLRPHGKLWGMDVFTWANVTPINLVATIHAFPFKVVWVGGCSEILRAIYEDMAICSNLQKIIIHEEQNTVLTDKQKEIGMVFAAEMQQVTQEIRETLPHAKILLFTASGTNWQEQMRVYEEFLNYLRS